MKNVNFTLLSLAILTVVCLMLIGVAIAERSIIGILLAVIASILVIGFGFVMKKKMRESGKL
ncbi:YlaF family protein [Bacillus sp. Marseille-P3661]|uniref:YlaF family protein n=1 Tax=Bacillus sp. Marseille-P3661 TaxID=1936234 RepID=UPI000C81C2C5|nr:YlaF family protein [Bacillus sp. Marseille-P3661]